VKVKIGVKEAQATFCQTDNGLFDLRYGWAEFTSGMHSTLDAALEDFRQRLRQKHPAGEIILGEPREISEEQAKRNSPNCEA
jgi:hypothetical protein